MAVGMNSIGRYLWQCLSTDTKPVPPTYAPHKNDVLLVTDTQTWYVYTGGTWTVSVAIPPLGNLR